MKEAHNAVKNCFFCKWLSLLIKLLSVLALRSFICFHLNLQKMLWDLTFEVRSLKLKWLRGGNLLKCGSWRAAASLRGCRRGWHGEDLLWCDSSDAKQQTMLLWRDQRSPVTLTRIEEKVEKVRNWRNAVKCGLGKTGKIDSTLILVTLRITLRITNRRRKTHCLLLIN